MLWLYKCLQLDIKTLQKCVPNFDVMNKSSRFRWYFGNNTLSASLIYCSLLYTAAVSEKQYYVLKYWVKKIYQ